MNFNIGDSVKLKSGSPKLTVTHLYLPSMSVEVMWIDGGELKAAVFPELSLELMEKEQTQ